MVQTDSPAAKVSRLISSIGNNRLRRGAHISQAGFTLVEMMTVLVIIGLMSSAVILTMPGNKPQLIVQSDALIAEVNALAQSSLITGRPKALGLSQDAYALMSFENGRWEVLTQTKFPSEVHLVLEREDVSVKLPATLLPLIVFEPTGLSTAFDLTLSDTERSMTLQSAGNGRVQLGRHS